MIELITFSLLFVVFTCFVCQIVKSANTKILGSLSPYVCDVIDGRPRILQLIFLWQILTSLGSHEAYEVTFKRKLINFEVHCDFRF